MAASPPTFATLPAEILRIIFPDPAHFRHYKLTEVNPGDESRWFPPQGARLRTPGSYTQLSTLHSLSQTNRRLRAIALPLLWSQVHLTPNSTSHPLKQLWLLREVLKASPFIAGYIKSWYFSWHLPGEPWDSPFKNKAEILRVLARMIPQFTSLQTFGWDSCYALPDAAFAALAKLKTLTSLHLDMGREKIFIRLLPFWELMRNGPTQLSLRFFVEGFRGWDPEPIEPQSERALLSYELPPKQDRYNIPKAEFAMPIACRTLITAVRGGCLKRLRVEKEMELPFAVRRLLPYWVGIEEWGDKFDVWANYFGDDRLGEWQFAARALRPLLGHVSAWRGTASLLKPREDRKLRRRDVRQLLPIIEFEGLEELYLAVNHQESAVARYLTWIEESDSLADAVVEAWNHVVEEGQENVRFCHCEKCRNAFAPPRGREDSSYEYDNSDWYSEYDVDEDTYSADEVGSFGSDSDEPESYE